MGILLGGGDSAFGWMPLGMISDRHFLSFLVLIEVL